METFSPQSFLTSREVIINNEKINDFFNKKVTLSSIETTPDIQCTACYIKHDNANAAPLVIIPGRGENPHKYAEFLYSADKFNFSTYILFARGQGISTRLLDNPQKCHIAKFEDYTHDISIMLNKLNITKFMLSGFSLGGLIALDLLLNTSHKPLKCALFAPFLWPNVNINPAVLKTLITVLGSLPFTKCSYTPYGSDYRMVNFEENYHSHCKDRYLAYHSYYKMHPEETLGGPTFGFVHQTMKKQCELFKSKQDINIPIYVQLAQQDRVVDSDKAEKFFTDHVKGKFSPRIEWVANAFHDLLNESDEIRNSVLCNALNFLYGVKSE